MRGKELETAGKASYRDPREDLAHYVPASGRGPTLCGIYWDKWEFLARAKGKARYALCPDCLLVYEMLPPGK